MYVYQRIFELPPSVTYSLKFPLSVAYNKFSHVDLFKRTLFTENLRTVIVFDSSASRYRRLPMMIGVKRRNFG